MKFNVRTLQNPIPILLVIAGLSAISACGAPASRAILAEGSLHGAAPSESGTPAHLIAFSATRGIGVAGAPLRIKPGEAVFFKNEESRRFLQIRIDGDFACARDCETEQGFQCLHDRAESRAIEPGGIVALCFHNSGKFKITILGPGKSLEGIMEVAAP
ncbi:MAG: hypothetical protein HY286_02700 [Planctomycetes bacterium]|nr:hypothetical protein [Planctomycetota bacterium]